jgi:hypothetical protein
VLPGCGGATPPANGIVIALERSRFLALFAQRDVDLNVVASAITILGVVIAVGL